MCWCDVCIVWYIISRVAVRQLFILFFILTLYPCGYLTWIRRSFTSTSYFSGIICCKIYCAYQMAAIFHVNMVSVNHWNVTWKWELYIGKWLHPSAVIMKRWFIMYSIMYCDLIYTFLYLKQFEILKRINLGLHHIFWFEILANVEHTVDQGINHAYLIVKEVYYFNVFFLLHSCITIGDFTH